MKMSSLTSPSSTTATINYCIPPENGVGAAQYAYKVEPANGVPQQRNFSLESKQVTVENARGNDDQTLDTAGFQFFRDTSTHTSFSNDADIVNEYYPESIELIKKHTGASRVVIFDHTIRHRQIGEDASGDRRRQPLPQAHVDQSYNAAVARVHKHLPPDDVPSLLQKRFQIVNLWRPIKCPALDWPLALCDCRSVDVSKDIIPVRLIYRDHEGGTLGVKYNPNHRWVYLHGMTPEEVVLFKCFESLQDGSVSLMAPHSGFEDPQTPSDAPLRQSIELRALVFYD